MELETELLKPILDVLTGSIPISAKCLCQNEFERAARLYLFSGDIRIAITVLSGDNNFATIYDLGCQPPVPKWLSSRIGIIELSSFDTSSFFDSIESLGIKNKNNCVTNSRDGLFSILVIADRLNEFCLRMNNPQLHDDPVYKSVINSFSECFLGGIIKL